MRQLREQGRCMISFRKESMPAVAPAGLPRMKIISVQAPAARRTLATSDFPAYVALTEQVPWIGLIMSGPFRRTRWRGFAHWQPVMVNRLAEIGQKQTFRRGPT